jgi:hypothetical protein
MWSGRCRVRRKEVRRFPEDYARLAIYINLALKQDLLDTEEPQEYEIRETRTHLLSNRIEYLDTIPAAAGDKLDGNIRTCRVQIRDPLRNLNKRHEIHASGSGESCSCRLRRFLLALWSFFRSGGGRRKNNRRNSGQNANSGSGTRNAFGRD